MTRYYVIILNKGLNKPPICILSVLRPFQVEPRELGPLHWQWIVNCSLYPAEDKGVMSDFTVSVNQ